MKNVIKVVFFILLFAGACYGQQTDSVSQYDVLLKNLSAQQQALQKELNDIEQKKQTLILDITKIQGAIEILLYIREEELKHKKEGN